MRAVVAQQLQRLIAALAGDDLQRGVTVDFARQVAQLAIDLHGKRRLCETGADGLGHGLAGHRARVAALGAVRKRDRDL